MKIPNRARDSLGQQILILLRCPRSLFLHREVPSMSIAVKRLTRGILIVYKRQGMKKRGLRI